ncbi:MAG: 5-amino-6-(D-ribitylamino)uracil--L-tyrosine 4-hydroxyphenyl transferase CofH [Candidatus Heimdallarchaeota archaeon]|nr:5-amino-6-(D-ribitylamino)uracil--L-tyrosine 4-hydroxyphenyl transferase CofH [Candidatus Heimdallarchaeota archaeon]
MKKLSPPKINEIIDLAAFSKSHTSEIEEVTTLLKKRGKDLWIQTALADDLRHQQVGDKVTYVINQNINFSNHCIGSCRFCSYRVPSNSNHQDSERLSLDDIKLETEKAIARGCTELCIQGGLDPEINFEFYLDLLKIIKSTAPGIHIHAFSPSEIAYMSQISGETVEDVFKELSVNGLDSFPGTAAEILVDDIRQVICPEKISTSQWINIVLTGHSLGIKSTATMMYGHIETLENEAEHLVLLKNMQEISKGFTEFIPLPFIHTNTVLYKYLGARPGSTGMHDLALLSGSRLYLGELFSNIQTSWVKLGSKFSQISLNVGVNDIGGTLFTENITKSAGGTHGEEMSAEEFIDLIRDADRIPAQRDTLYNILKTH